MLPTAAAAVALLLVDAVGLLDSSEFICVVGLGPADSGSRADCPWAGCVDVLGGEADLRLQSQVKRLT